MNRNAPDWQVELDDFGGRMVRHRHPDLTAIAYVYGNPDRVWAECSMCGSELDLVVAVPLRVGAANAPSGE
jgi:hypothetical protein